MSLNTIEKDIKLIKEIFNDKLNNIEKINYGWSIDRKYILSLNNKKLICRLTNCREKDKIYSSRINQFNNLSKIKSNFVPKAIDYGYKDNTFYTILEYLEGEDLELKLQIFSEKDQYKLGLKAGNILKEIHETRIDTSKYNNWAKDYDRNNRRRIVKYKELIKNEPKYYMENMDKVIDVLVNESCRIYNRKLTLCHGDYHIGNMIVNKNELYIIDFGSSSIDDPYEEYDRFVFTIRKSKAFANGQLHSYFNGNPSLDFFHLMRYYTARNYLSSILWSIPFGEDEVQVAMENINLIDNYYDNFNLIIPNWYINVEKVNY